MHPTLRPAILLLLLAPPLWPPSSLLPSPPPPPKPPTATPATSTLREPRTSPASSPCRQTISAQASCAEPRRAGSGPARSRSPSAAPAPTPYTAVARVAWSKLCPNQLVEDKIAGVPVRIVTPDGMPEANRDKVLLNLHGGGFNSDSGSYTESIPIAGYTKIKVVAVLYRLAPEHPFPAAVDDSVAVYKELLKTYKPKHIVIYGTSAGAILTAEVAARLKQLGLPLPAALGIFSGMGDFARDGDSISLYALRGFSGHLDPPEAGPHDPDYVTTTDPKDPVLSPIYSDLHGLPPTLFITSGRDLLLSGTANLHRAYLNAGVDARLVVYDALPHAFWYDPRCPRPSKPTR